MQQSKYPLIAVINRFNFTQKFFFVSLLFVISVLISTYFMLQVQNEKLHIQRAELIGIEELKLTRKFLEDVARLELLILVYNEGNSSQKVDILELQSKISQDVKDVISFGSIIEHSKAEGFQAEEKELRSRELETRWNQLTRSMLDSTGRPKQIRDSLIENIKEYFSEVGDSSHLNMDVSLNTYYLIQALIYSLPSGQALVPQILTNLSFTKEESNPENKGKIFALVYNFKNSIDETASNFNRAFHYDKAISYNQDTEYKLRDPLKQYSNSSRNFIEIIENILQNPKELDYKELIALGNNALKANFSLWDQTIEEVEKLTDARVKNRRNEQILSVLFSLFCSALGIAIGLIIIREISRPLNNLISAAKRLASGDLSTRVAVEYDDEIGQVGIAFNQMAESFQELIGQLQWTGIQLTTSTTEIAATAKQQEATIVQQEATTKQIAATAREITSTAKDLAKTMNEVSGNAEQTSSLAASGRAGLSRMETIMRQMVEASGNISSKLAILNEKAGSITSVITTITKVADQTNLLSLNAAIEAEKAGEHGRSFAVIAREIRRLADQTAHALLDIERMVNEMVSAVSAGVMGVDKFSEEINTGVNQVNDVGEQLSKIIEQVQQQTGSFELVNQGMQAQSLSAEQINESITQLSEAAQQTTESIRQFHNAIEQLNSAAQEMQMAVTKIKR